MPLQLTSVYEMRWKYTIVSFIPGRKMSWDNLRFCIPEPHLAFHINTVLLIDWFYFTTCFLLPTHTSSKGIPKTWENLGEVSALNVKKCHSDRECAAFPVCDEELHGTTWVLWILVTAMLQTHPGGVSPRIFVLLKPSLSHTGCFLPEEKKILCKSKLFRHFRIIW